MWEYVRTSELCSSFCYVEKIQSNELTTGSCKATEHQGSFEGYLLSQIRKPQLIRFAAEKGDIQGEATNWSLAIPSQTNSIWKPAGQVSLGGLPKHSEDTPKPRKTNATCSSWQHSTGVSKTPFLFESPLFPSMFSCRVWTVYEKKSDPMRMFNYETCVYTHKPQHYLFLIM